MVFEQKTEKAKVADLGLSLFLGVAVFDLLGRSFQRLTRLSDHSIKAVQSIVVF